MGAARFLVEGWVSRLLVDTSYHFSFWGFDWVPRPGAFGAHGLYIVILASALAVAAGWRFRWTAPVFVLSFAYAELLDATHYLNHYYLVVLLGTLLCLTPAHAARSLDARAGRVQRCSRVPAWCVWALRAQVALVYVFAGVAKVNADWLLRAMPLAVWLPEHAAVPLVGPLLAEPTVAYLGSWAACLYDLTIVGWLLYRPTRPWAYGAVLVFHGATWALFNIGLFPLIMSTSTLLFFPGAAHRRVWAGVRQVFATSDKTADQPPAARLSPGGRCPARPQRSVVRPPALLVQLGLTAYFVLQFALPLRALAYPGSTAWTEEGYRFGWRVMLVEKSGVARFTLVDRESGRRVEVDPARHLSAYQTKQLAIQPDFIWQFARYLARERGPALGFSDPAVYADVWVALNGRRSARLVDPAADLTRAGNGLAPKPWICPHP